MLSEQAHTRTRWIIALLFLAGFILFSRIYFRSPYLFTWDSINYALSLEEFNIHIHQPHPPGYILYSFTVRVLNWMVHDPNLSMIQLNILATVGTCVFIMLLVLELKPGSFPAAVGAAILYATNPVSWFYGSVAEIYAVEGFFAACLGYLVMASFRKHSLLLSASFVMAIAGGFRPTTEIFLAPFYLAAFFGKNRKTILGSLGILIVCNLAWFIPLVEISGGLHPYWERLQRQGMEAASKTSLLVDETAERGPDVRSIPIVLAQACTLPVLLALLIRFIKIRLHAKQWLLFLALIPPILFFVAIHYAKDGYLLLVIPIWVCLCMTILDGLYRNSILLAVLVLLAALSNGWIFIATPRAPEKKGTKTTEKWIKDEFRSPNKSQMDDRINQYQAFFSQLDRFDETKLLIAPQNAYPNWRTLMYYLPEWEIVVPRPEKKGYFVFDHKLKLIRGPFRIHTKWVVTAGRKEPGLEIDSFSVKRNRYYFARSQDLPKRLRLYDFDFINGQRGGK